MPPSERLEERGVCEQRGPGLSRVKITLQYKSSGTTGGMAEGSWGRITAIQRRERKWLESGGAVGLQWDSKSTRYHHDVSWSLISSGALLVLPLAMARVAQCQSKGKD